MLNKISTLLLGILLLVQIGCNGDKKEATSANNPVLVNGTLKDYADSLHAGIIKQDTMKKSVQRVAENSIKGTIVRVQYHSPGVRGRKIWGGLVPYNQVWSAGAHSATNVHFSTEVLVGQRFISAGDYAFFAIPGIEEWTLILNKNYQQHLADDYSDSLDVVNIKVKPIILDDTIQRLTYLVKPNGEGTGSINLYWEKLFLSMPFTVVKNTVAKNGTGGSGKIALKNLAAKYKRDPVCFMPVSAGISDTTLYDQKIIGFCSSTCKNLFVQAPEKYAEQLK